MIRRALGFLARHRLAPRRRRYSATFYTPSNYCIRIDWATPEVIGRWVADLVDSGVLDPPAPGQWQGRFELYPLELQR